MRITQDTSYRNLLRDIQRIAERMQDAQDQISSGKKLSRPSDDPSAAADVIQISAERGEIGQYLKNLATGRTRLDFADTILGGVEEMTERIRNLALLAQSNVSRAGLYTAEISGLRDSLLAAANSTAQGQFIFGGSQTETDPYVKQNDGSVTYAGNSDVVKLQTGRSSTLQIQVPGSDIFSSSVDIFTVVQDLVDAMNNGDKAGIVAQTGKLEQFYDLVGSNRSRVGGLINVAQTAETELNQYSLARTVELSRLEDADLPQALSEFTQSQTALQAAMAVGARISNISILDYLK